MNVCVRTSRERTCASSCAMTASSSSRRSARSRPVETASVALWGPRPTTNARGIAVVDQSAASGGADPELGGDPVGGRAQDRILRQRERSRTEHPEQGPVAEPVHGDRAEQDAEHEQGGGSSAPDQPAEARRTGPPGSLRAGAPWRRSPPHGAAPPSLLLRARRRGRGAARSGSGASQRLEQCNDATFCSGTRMCPLSST